MATASPRLSFRARGASGILKLAGNTMAAPMMQPNGTHFGGWLLDTSNNNFGLAADYDQDHRAEAGGFRARGAWASSSSRAAPWRR